MGRVIRLTSTFVRPADNTAYAAGDEVSNHATAGSVVRSTFDLQGFQRGRVLSMALDVTPASGNVVITAFNLQAALYKTADAPAAVGDNVTHPIAAAVTRKAIGLYLFDDGGWMNPLGAFTASTSGYQETPATMAVPLATPTIAAPHVPGHVFEFLQGEAAQLTLVMRALAAWTPTGVANTFGVTLELEVE